MFEDWASLGECIKSLIAIGMILAISTLALTAMFSISCVAHDVTNTEQGVIMSKVKLFRLCIVIQSSETEDIGSFPVAVTHIIGTTIPEGTANRYEWYSRGVFKIAIRTEKTGCLPHEVTLDVIDCDSVVEGTGEYAETLVAIERLEKEEAIIKQFNTALPKKGFTESLMDKMKKAGKQIDTSDKRFRPSEN